MPIDPSSTLAAPRPARTNPREEQNALGRDAFMKLLVTQLRNQDPLEPMDAREMVTQLSQLSSVEQLVSIEQRLQHLEIATAGIGNTQVAALVGKEVTAEAKTMLLVDGGTGHAAYDLKGRASEVRIEVRDASGRVVRTIRRTDEFPGLHTVEWDGRDDAGERLPPGRYSIEITATDGEGHPVEVSTRITGRVDGVSYESGFPELMVGETRIMLGDVVSIRQ